DDRAADRNGERGALTSAQTASRAPHVKAIDQATRNRSASGEKPRPHPPGCLHRVADLPEGGRPETDEQGAPFRVPALVLVDGLRSNPEADAQRNRAQREGVELRAAETES